MVEGAVHRDELRRCAVSAGGVHPESGCAVTVHPNGERTVPAGDGESAGIVPERAWLDPELDGVVVEGAVPRCVVGNSKLAGDAVERVTRAGDACGRQSRSASGDGRVPIKGGIGERAGGVFEVVDDAIGAIPNAGLVLLIGRRDLTVVQIKRRIGSRAEAWDLDPSHKRSGRGIEALDLVIEFRRAIRVGEY